MKPLRTIARRQLDQRLEGLADRVGPRPARGWIRTVRDALGMSTYELAARMVVTAPRVTQLERAELDGSIRLSTLGRAAEALGCRLVYALVPDASLEQSVRGQARQKATELVLASTPSLFPEDEAVPAEVTLERIEALASELVDRRGLWSDGTPPKVLWERGVARSLGRPQ